MALPGPPQPQPCCQEHPSASTSRSRRPGFSTKGSPGPSGGTVTRAGSVLGGKGHGLALLCAWGGDSGLSGRRSKTATAGHGHQPPGSGEPGLPARMGMWWELGGEGGMWQGWVGRGSSPSTLVLGHVVNLPSSRMETRPLTLVGPRLT